MYADISKWQKYGIYCQNIKTPSNKGKDDCLNDAIFVMMDALETSMKRIYGIFNSLQICLFIITFFYKSYEWCQKPYGKVEKGRKFVFSNIKINQQGKYS